MALRGPLIELSRPVSSCAGPFPVGHRGSLSPTQGWGHYDLHREVPLDGFGVPLDAVLVIVTDVDGTERKLSLRDWSRPRRRSLQCSRCGINVLDPRRADWSTPEFRAMCRVRRGRLDRLARLLRAALDARKALQATS